MKRSFLLVGALYGFLTSLILMAISYLGNSLFGLPFLPFDLFDWLTRTLPGGLIEAGISAMVSVITALNLGPIGATAKLAEQTQALVIVAVTGIVFGAVMGFVRAVWPAWLKWIGLLGGGVLWAGMLLVEFSLPSQGAGMIVGILWLLLLLLGWGWLLTRLFDPTGRNPAAKRGQDSMQTTSQELISRRNFLSLSGAGLLSLIILGLGLKRFSQGGSSASTGQVVAGGGATPPASLPFGPEYTTGPAASPSLAALAKRIEPAPGTRAEITPTAQFYRIDINTLPPVVNGSTWRLNIKGLVDQPLSLSLEDLSSLPSASQAVTMSCISNPVGGDLIGTNFWTGVRLKDVLAQVGVKPSATAISVSTADGFYESIPLDEAMDERALLVYAMNGDPLEPKHGFPLRVYLPNHYGMKQPKWITDMELVENPIIGYWVERGWSQTANPQITSVIDTLSPEPAAIVGGGVMPLGGIAWAGDRGISKVEVQIDQDPWATAELRDPPESPLTWVQWRYDWKTTPGNHTVKVRAVDGQGVPQNEATTDPAPEGATGLNSVVIKI